MSTRRNRRVSHISPDTSKTATRRNKRAIHISPDASKRTVTFHTYKYNGRTKSANGRKEVPKSAGYCPCHLLRNARHSAVKILRIVRAKMTRTFCLISRRDTGKDNRDSAHQKFAPARDSHQSEAVEDCIAFMNSSSRKYE
ncbi:hypothetical protein FCM35_KLT20717 [Carex littledalei]|uniref:Uncharacterized protein n=1 Tax=Carex littledalei TaxID=544730 RepID=A0A833R6J3_9POAL|nr:hypothetical protein FCM35_KLT20717 [Carex littledalei]